MKNEYIQKESNIKNNLKIKIVNILSKIKKDYDNNIIIPLNIYDLNDCLDEIKSEKVENLTDIIKLPYLKKNIYVLNLCLLGCKRVMKIFQ